MISKEEIKKLADLARISLEDGEIEKLRGEMNAILDYVGQVKSVAGEEKAGEISEHYNVMREDGSPDRPAAESGTRSKELIEEFPEKKGDYLKVKKII